MILELKKTIEMVGVFFRDDVLVPFENSKKGIMKSFMRPTYNTTLYRPKNCSF